MVDRSAGDLALEGADAGTHPLGGEVRLLLQVAMVVFLWTIGIGILNGVDAVDFDRKVLLSHVHAGTLGWITTCVIAASIWLFGRGASPGETSTARVLARLTVVVLPLFALTFAFTYDTPRAVIGGVAATVILAMFSWVAVRARSVVLSTIHLGFLAAMATSVVGAAFGVLLAADIANDGDLLSDGAADAHPATMVVGFLIPVGMALAEWGLRGTVTEPAGRLGTAQVVLPFTGGLVLMIGLVLEVDALPPLATLIELAGVVIFFKRLWQPLRSVAWSRSGPERFAAASAIAIIVNIVFLNYLAGANNGDFDKVGDNQLLALDHTMFIGVLTNAIFALLLLATRRSRWPRLDDVVFVGMNAALFLFVVSLLAETTWLMRLATPVMGACILAGLLDRTLGLLDARTGGALTTSPAPELRA
jgi:hypothetical protein